MNKDLISRSALLEEFEWLISCINAECSDVEDAMKRIKKAPAVDAEPVRHGRWKAGESEFGWAEDIDCSECGSMYNFFKKPNYCPNCGAKMDAEENDMFVDCKKCVHLKVHLVETNVLNKHTGKPEWAEWYKCDFHPFSLPTTKRYSCMFFTEHKMDAEVE